MLRGQDILLMLKLAAHGGRRTARMLDLGLSLGLSQPEISNSIKRCRASRLLSEEQTVLYRNLTECCIYGLPYFMPGELGPVTVGIATAHSVAPLRHKLVVQDEYVWPWAEGNTRGQQLQPIYASVPKAASADARLYELLALVDVLRIGKARDKQLAKEMLENLLNHYATV